MPDPDDPALSETVAGIDETGAPVETRVAVERPLTLFLNRQEIVTVMTIGDRPEWLAVGFLRNQHMLRDDDRITAIEHDDDLGDRRGPDRAGNRLRGKAAEERSAPRVARRAPCSAT